MAKKANGSTKAKAGKASKKKEASVKHRVLSAIASQRAFGKDQVEKKDIIRLACITNEHTFDTNCSSMKKKGLIEQIGSCLKLTEKGVEAIGGEDAIAAATHESNEDAQDILKEQVKGGTKARAIFDLLTNGNAYTRAEIAEKLGYDQNKTFQTYMSYLSKLVDKVDGNNKVRLKDIAFPCGRPCDKA